MSIRELNSYEELFDPAVRGHDANTFFDSGRYYISLAELAADTESVEETIFQYSSRGESNDGKLWLADDSGPRDQFDFGTDSSRSPA
jgi:hypothetical protein